MEYFDLRRVNMSNGDDETIIVFQSSTSARPHDEYNENDVNVGIIPIIPNAESAQLIPIDYFGDSLTRTDG